MAFRTNKTPAIEERTVSGSSVSFNTAFALPLKACISNFEGYQEGSGIPSPSNIRLLHAYSQATLTENNTPHVLTFGRSVYLGSINWLTGEVIASWLLYNLGNLTWDYDRQYSRFVSNIIEEAKQSGARGLTFYCECYRNIDDRRLLSNVPDLSIYNGSEKALYIHDSTFGNDVNSLIAFITDKYVALPLAEPITIQLSPTELSSIIGNNTFSTDTGTLEITFADLQEKSASGSVATFNTALAMPLVECKTGFMFTQSGTGDPTPQNVRPFVTISDITIDANSNTFTCDLNGSRAGGVIDLVNKIGTITWIIQKISDMEINYYAPTSSYPFGFFIARGIPRKKNGLTNVNSEIFKTISGGFQTNYRCFGNNAYDYIYIIDGDYSSADDFKTNLGNYEFAYELETPIEISLSDIPTLSTIIGNNSFASDSGSIELKYKDLDIAKRGSFREVFKLPS